MDDGNSRKKSLAAAAMGFIAAIATTAIYAIVSVFSRNTEGDKSKEKEKNVSTFVTNCDLETKHLLILKRIV